jgi:GT2 family glycosyltransferase
MNLSNIIPTCNSECSLAECIEALQYHDGEIIVVDDGSVSPVKAPSDVRLIRHDSSRGRAAALNSGIKQASNDLVLLLDDDMYVAQDTVVRLVDEFAVWNNPKVAITARTLWDPDVTLTPTMRWLEESGPLHEVSADRSGLLSNLSARATILWKPFVLEHGGFDEKFPSHSLEDLELGLRLKPHGLEVRLLASTVVYHHKVVKVRDLVNRELQEGAAAYYLHSKFPEYLPQVEDVDTLFSNISEDKEAAEALAELELLEESDTNKLPTGISDLFLMVYRHYFSKGILEGLKSQLAVRQSRRNIASQGLYNEAAHLQAIGELEEARRLFRLVRDRHDSEYWPGAEYNMGVIETMLGDSGKAQAHFLDCLRLDPMHSQAREAIL